MRVEGDSSDILKVQGMRNNELSDTEVREDKELLVHVRFSCPGQWSSFLPLSVVKLYAKTEGTSEGKRVRPRRRRPFLNTQVELSRRSGRREGYQTVCWGNVSIWAIGILTITLSRLDGLQGFSGEEQHHAMGAHSSLLFPCTSSCYRVLFVIWKAREKILMSQRSSPQILMCVRVTWRS